MGDPTKRGAGSSGHPEPGSGHDDAKTETVADGPAAPLVDGIPGAFGEVETRGDVAGDTNLGGPGAEIEDETSS